MIIKVGGRTLKYGPIFFLKFTAKNFSKSNHFLYPVLDNWFLVKDSSICLKFHLF